MVDRKALHHDFFFVVVALHQGLARHIVLTLNLRGVVLDVVAAAGSRVNAAARHAFNDFRIGNRDFQNEVDRHTGGLQGLRLGNRARKPVKEESLLAVILREAFLHKTDDDVVAHKSPLIHDDLGGLAEFGAGLDSSAQHVARGNLGNAEALLNESGLSALTGTGRSDENQTHLIVSKN